MMFDEACSVTLREGAEDWSLVAAGDVCPIARVEKGLLEGGPEAIMGPGVLQVLRNGDVTLVNLESPICSSEEPILKTGPNFISSPGVVKAIKSAGIDVVALANNHIRDQGTQGIGEPLKVLDAAGIKHHGAGPSLEVAVAPVTLKRAGHEIVFLNVAEGEFGRSHEGGAGNEYQPFPSPLLQDVYHQFVDAGATVVIAHHPHIPQGVEIYGEGVIIYSLGNFLFDYPGHVGKPCTKVGFFACLGFGASHIVSVQLLPYRTHADATVELLGKEDSAHFATYMNAISDPLTAPEELAALWEQETRGLYDSTYAPLFDRIFQKASGKSGPDGPPLDQISAGIMFNLFQCEAHNEATKTAFRLMYENRFSSNPTLQRVIDKAHAVLKKLAE